MARMSQINHSTTQHVTCYDTSLAHYDSAVEGALNAINTVIPTPYYYVIVHHNWRREDILRELERGTDTACHHVQEVEDTTT